MLKNPGDLLRSITAEELSLIWSEMAFFVNLKVKHESGTPGLLAHRLSMHLTVLNLLGGKSAVGPTVAVEGCTRQCYTPSASSNALATWRSAVSKPSMNQP